ncbi:hypothetical protein ATY41_08410 [Leifsonia xyli subsp. xyli]|uniref:Gram-positive cocci surface proteins LPxTG domain-containing protein n=1 Tax=Leifsonia xyli subsp. xyli TaxID=59736 RepID=A0A1E2SME0_LEIXY|nr:LPXTG cell wall anchor domain-containing protein [Leifsonia xyli]ODA90794.1 hypothetical protein ATY41_08410 [Leifsonia xyli subsp. xyli]
MTARTLLRRPAALLAAAAVAAAALGAALLPATLLPAAPATAAAAATAATYSASGVEIIDIDGGTLQAPKPSVSWTTSAETSSRLDATGDLLKLNTTRTSDLAVTAGPTGATATIGSGEFTLRDRVPVTFRGLSVVCSPTQASTVSFTALTVNGTDITATATATPGFTYQLPSSQYGATKIIVGERTTNKDGSITTTALRVEAEAGASEIWRIRAGRITCPPAAPAPARVTATGLRVAAPDGSALVAGEPSVSGEGQTKTAATVDAASSYPAHSKNVSVTTAADGSASVGIGEFTQVPDQTSGVGEYRWNALRVYGLRLSVAADGSSTVKFDNASSAVFANGVWGNTATDLYTGLGSDGAERVRVHFNERTTAADGSVTINALRYEDLTHANPGVTLGTVVLAAPKAIAPAKPADGPADPDNSGTLPAWNSYGIAATGPSPVRPVAVSRATAQPQKSVKALATPAEESASAPTAGDGKAGQIAVGSVTTTSSATGASATVGQLRLYPGTTVEVSLKNLLVKATGTGVVVSSDGGTVAGRPLAAGTIAPDTRIEVPGTTIRVVLNEQSRNGSEVTVHGFHLTDASGLATDVVAAVLTTAAVPADTAPPLTPASTGPGGILVPGALAPDGKSPAGMSDTGSSALASTGSTATPGLLVGAGLLVAAGTGIAVFRRRRRSGPPTQD